MSRDERVYPRPEEFRPERFHNLDHETADLLDPRRFSFGFGRRICPGSLLADRCLWLAISNVIATLDITKACDASGQVITPLAAWESGFVSLPVKFMADIRPRSEQRLELIREIDEKERVL